jgi:hypothetical protein
LLPLELHQGILGSWTHHPVRPTHIETLLIEFHLNLAHHALAEAYRTSGCSSLDRLFGWNNSDNAVTVVDDHNVIAHYEVIVAPPLWMYLDEGVWDSNDPHVIRHNRTDPYREINIIHSGNIVAREDAFANLCPLLRGQRNGAFAAARLFVPTLLGLPLALGLSILLGTPLLVLTLLLVPSQLLVLILLIPALALGLAVTVVLGTPLISPLLRFALTLVLPSAIWRRLAGRAVRWRLLRLALSLPGLLSLAFVLRLALALSRLLCLAFVLRLALPLSGLLSLAFVLCLRCSAGIAA